MKQAMAAILALAGAGCVEVERQEFDKLSTDVKNLQIYQKNDHEMQAHLYSELTQKFGSLVKQVTELDTLVRAMQASVDRLELEMKALQHTKRSETKGVEGPIAIGPGPNVAEIQLQIEQTLGGLRQGKLKPEDALKLLEPYSVYATPKILDELAGAVTQFEYAKQLESILSKFPSDTLKAPLQKALGQAGLRQSAARVVGHTKDPGLGKLLESFTEGNDEDFKLTVGDSLVQCRNAKGIPILIVSLRSGEATTRTIAIAALKRLNRGEDFGYRAQASNDANAEPLRAWAEWGEKSGKTIFQ
jgi:outer membrane murein-binding lipoprotein Lpp